MRVLAFGLACGTLLLAANAAAAIALSIDDVVRQAVADNPQVRAAQAQYRAAAHQIDQAYSPQDPAVSYSAADSIAGVNHPQGAAYQVSENFQFPGKSWLQGKSARRAAEIARLTYQAAVRDASTQARIAFYQTLLDSAAAHICLESAGAFSEVLEIAKVAYTANRASQTDLISAQSAVSQAREGAQIGRMAEANDEAALNLVLGRDPESPLELAGGLELEPLEWTLDAVERRALESRQELLAAALTEKNAGTARTLARMEMLPDFSASYAYNRFYEESFAPQPGDVRDNTLTIGMSVPVFFWFHQKEDAAAASRLLEAARDNRRLAELQAMASVVELYRSTRQAYRNAVLYRDLLVPLAAQNFKVALISYQSKQIDFTTLSSILQSVYSSRLGYLAAVNQFLAGRVALEQAMGGAQKP